MKASEIDSLTIRAHLDAFYAKVRQDPRLGPVFNTAVHDWPEHMEKLTAFWCTVVLRQPGYKGNPLAVHQALSLPPDQFARLLPEWLDLWAETARENFSPDLAAFMTEKAQRIARSLEAGLLFDPDAPRKT